MVGIVERDIARRIIKKYGVMPAYDLATWILYELEWRRCCIWQTYTMDDIEQNMGRKPTADEIDEMQERLVNSFEYIRPKE